MSNSKFVFADKSAKLKGERVELTCDQVFILLNEQDHFGFLLVYRFLSCYVEKNEANYFKNINFAFAIVTLQNVESVSVFISMSDQSSDGLSLTHRTWSRGSNTCILILKVILRIIEKN